MANRIVVFERRYLPNVRKKEWYKIIKFIVTLPITTLLLFAYIVKTYILDKIKIKRKNKPDIVLKNIIAGWTNLLIDDPVIEEVATHRANICAKCPYAEFVGGIHTVVIDNKTTQIRGLKCGKCGCPLSAKVRSSSDYCPDGRW